MLGPLHFVLHIEHLPRVVLSAIFLFTDDTKIFSRIEGIMPRVIVLSERTIYEYVEKVSWADEEGGHPFVGEGFPPSPSEISMVVRNTDPSLRNIQQCKQTDIALLPRISHVTTLFDNFC